MKQVIAKRGSQMKVFIEGFLVVAFMSVFCALAWVFLILLVGE